MPNEEKGSLSFYIHSHSCTAFTLQQETKVKCKQKKIWGEIFLHTEVSHTIFTQAKSNMCCFDRVRLDKK